MFANQEYPQPEEVEAARSLLFARHHSHWDPAATEQLVALLRREASCDRYGAIGTVDGVEELARKDLCNWLYEFVDYFSFDREVVGVALNYFDRYMYIKRALLSTDGLHLEHQLRLIVLSSLYVAIKAHGRVSEGDNVHVTRSLALSRLLMSYQEGDPQDVIDKELDIMQTLEWRLNPPTMHQYALAYLHLHPLRNVCPYSAAYLHEAARYQAEHVAFHPGLLERFSPSVIAFASYLNASANVDEEILTPALKDQWLFLMSHPDINIDPAQVREAQSQLLSVCPVPGMDAFQAARYANGVEQEPQGRTSPTNIAQY